MKSSKLILAILVVFICNKLIGQDVQVYHGTDGRVSIYSNNITLSSNASITKKVGEELHIKIINPNPYYYKYYFVIDSITISEEFPDVTEFVSGLIPLLNGPTEVTNERSSTTNIKKITNTFDIEEFSALLQYIESVELKYKDLTKKIEDSDIPTEIKLNLPSSFSNAQASILKEHAKLVVNEELFKKEAENISAKQNNINSEIESIKLALDIEKDDKQKEKLNIEMSLLAEKQKTFNVKNALIKSIKAHAKCIVADFNKKFEEFTGYSPLIEKKIKIKENQQLKVKILISKKRDSASQRGVSKEDGTNSISINCIPKYKRSIVELLPLAITPIRFDRRNNFTIVDNTIKSSNQDLNLILASTMLNFNVIPFGERKKNSLGVGIGTNLLPIEDISRNIFIGMNVNFTDKFRIGLGFGGEKSTVLNDGFSTNSMVVEGTNIDVITDEIYKPTGFITLTIFGFNLLNN